MKWLEIIELRTPNKPRSELLKILKLLIADLNSEPDKLKVRIYRSYNIESDYSIHLLHLRSEPIAEGSALGVHLTQYLRSFGLINHHSWYPIDRHTNHKTVEHENLDHRGWTPG